MYLSVQDVRYTTNEEGGLVIRKTSSSDDGTYACKPFNLLGSRGESTPVLLRVKDPPYFEITPKTQYEIEIGKSLDLSCKGNGEPIPQVSWTKVRYLYYLF